MAQSSKNVVKKGNIVYINTGKDWYQYDEKTSVIGSGAMGIVYAGFHCVTHCRVAIKMVRNEYANNPNIRFRAKQEASLMFMHPHLIEMLGYCEWEHGRGPIWIISKLVQGNTIDKYLANFPRSKEGIKRICNMFINVLDALDYLHTGTTPILHLDVKPSNIMVENGNNVRLMDLGISSVHDGVVMGSHGMMGTPNYAAPEQFCSDASYGEIGPRADIYEAAVTLYELLTKVNPYSSNTVHDSAVKHKKLILPESQFVPYPVLQVLRKATNSHQEGRYESVKEFKSALLDTLIEKDTQKSIFGWLSSHFS